MRGRLGLFVGFGAGYVLGAKAGRDRYEQLRRLYDNLMASPAVREASEKAKEAATAGIEQAKDMASGGVGKVTSVMKERRSGTDDHPSGLSVAPPPDYSTT